MNIRQAVSDLLETGLTQSQLALAADCSQSLISALFSGKRGVRTSYGIAKRIEQLHAATVGTRSGGATGESK